MNMSFHNKRPRLFLAGCIVFVLLFSLGIRFVHLAGEFRKNHQLYFYEDDVPLMTTLDAYFYLKIAKKMSPGEVYHGFSPRLLPLLSVATAAIHRATGTHLEKIAFYLPPVLACFMVLIYFWWGRELGGNVLFGLAVFIGMGSYYWYSRTCLGRFDTDSLIPFFVYGISFASFKFAVLRDWKRRLIYLVAGLAMCYAFQWWWHPGRTLALPLLAAPYALSVFFWPCNRVEKGVKALLLLAVLLAGVSLMFDLYRSFPPAIAALFEPLRPLLALLAESAGKGVSSSGAVIGELTPATLELVVENVAGSVILLGLSAFGFLLLARRYYRFLIPMIGPLGFALGFIFARRLLIFLVPVYAVSLAYFFLWLSRRKFLDKLPHPVRQWGIIAAAFFVIAVNTAKAATVAIMPRATSYQVAIAKTAGQKAGPGAMMWCWWDQGYFLAYFADRRTIIDGGRQSPDRMFVAASPLASQDPVSAANWITFFAARGKNAYRRINRHIPDPSKAVEFLREAFSLERPLGSLLSEYGLDDREAYWKNYLFPEAEVYLYLNHELFEKSPWWFSYGSGKTHREQGSRPKASIFTGGQFAIDARKGDIAFENRLIGMSSLYLFKFRPIPRVVAHRAYEDRNGPAALWARDLDIAYLFDRPLEKSLFMKLLLLDPYSPPEGFELVTYTPLQGGLWKVK